MTLGTARPCAGLSWSPGRLTRSQQCCAGAPAHPSRTQRAMAPTDKGALEATRQHPGSRSQVAALPRPSCAMETGSSERAGLCPFPVSGCPMCLWHHLHHTDSSTPSPPRAAQLPEPRLGRTAFPSGESPRRVRLWEFREASALAEPGEQGPGATGRRWLSHSSGLWGVEAVWGAQPPLERPRAGPPRLQGALLPAPHPLSQRSTLPERGLGFQETRLPGR